ncbi:MAG: hypothetical protein V1894_07045 [Chloroflexota bacterium]
MSSDHAHFKYSVTVRTNDVAVLHCLRALCQYAQREGSRQIGWGGTKEKDWQNNQRSVTFRFTNPAYRQDFLKEANRLLAGLWTKISSSDNDPATPQR